MELADIRALESVLTILKPLSPEDRERVLRWALEKLNVKNLSMVNGIVKSKEPEKLSLIEKIFEKHTNFENIGEFVAAAYAQTDVDRVLTAAVYLQDFADDPQRTLSGKDINDELKHLGYGVKNIGSIYFTQSRQVGVE